MKHTCKYLVVSLLVASFIPLAAIAQEVYSLNIVGFQKGDVESGLDILANPFEPMIIRDVVGNEGVYGTAMDIADNVIVYDADIQNFKVYYLRSHSSIGYPEWLSGAQWATNVYLSPGQGFFYRSRLANTRTNVVAGDVVLAAAVTNLVRPGLQLFSYPFATRVRMSDMNLKNGKYGTAMDIADNIMVYDPNIQNYTVYYLRSHSSIGYPEWLSGAQWATNVYIEQGQGFWFRSRMESTYEWVETTPYPDI